MRPSLCGILQTFQKYHSIVVVARHFSYPQAYNTQSYMPKIKKHFGRRKIKFSRLFFILFCF